MKKLLLINDDCLNAMQNITDKSIDMFLCDLPYGTTACKWDIVISFDLLWQHYNRIIKDKGAIVLFGCEPFSSYLRLSNIKNYKYDWKWVKEKPTNVFTIKKQAGRVVEDIIVFYGKQPTYNPVMKLRDNITNPKPAKGNLNIDMTNVISGCYKHSTDYNPNVIYPTNVLFFNRDSKKGKPSLHPTQKPVALLEYLIKTYTNENELVLDNTMGSGSTGVACFNTNRNFIGIEKDKDYFNIAKDRIESENNKINLEDLI